MADENVPGISIGITGDYSALSSALDGAEKAAQAGGAKIGSAIGEGFKAASAAVSSYVEFVKQNMAAATTAMGSSQAAMQELGRQWQALKAAGEQASTGFLRLSESARSVVEQQSALEQSAREAAATVNELRAAMEGGVVTAQAVARAEGELREALTRANAGMTEAQQAAQRLAEEQRQLETANRTAMQSFLDSGNAAVTSAAHYQQLQAHLTDISEKAKQLGSDLTSLGTTLSIGLTAPIVGVGAAALKTAGELEQNSIAFQTMLGSAAAAQEHLERLRAFALTTPFQFEDLVLASKRMQALGFEAKEVIPALTSIGDAAAALGLGAEGINRVVTALGQMKAKGMIQAEEMRQLAEAGIPAWQILAKTLETDVAGAMKMVEERTVEAATAVPALLAGMNEKFGGLMAAQAKTLLGQWSNFKDALSFTLADIGTSIAPVFKGMMEDIVLPLLGTVKDLAAGFKALPDPLQQFTVGVLGLTAALGPALIVTGKMIEGFGQLAGVAAKLVPAFAETSAAAGGIAGNMGLLEAASVTTGLSIGGLALAVGGLVAGAAIAWIELQQGLAPLHSLDESFNTWLGSTKELDKILAQMAVSMREATVAIEAGVNPSKELTDAWDKAAKAGAELEKQRKNITEAHNAGWITDDTAAQKYMALREASEKLKESQGKLIGLEWKQYATDIGVVIEVTGGLSEASKKLVAEQKSAETELKNAKKAYEELKAAQDGSLTMAKALERAHDDLVAAQKKANNETKESAVRWKEYDGALIKATERLSDHTDALGILARQLEQAYKDHENFNKQFNEFVRAGGAWTATARTASAIMAEFVQHVNALNLQKIWEMGEAISRSIDPMKTAAQEMKNISAAIEAMTAIPLDPTQQAVRDLGLKFVDVKRNVDLAFGSLQELINNPRVNPLLLTQAFDVVGRSIQQLAQVDLPAAIVKQQEYIDKLIATHRPLTMIAEALAAQNAMIRQNLEDQIYVAEQQGKSADEAYIKLVNLDQKLKDLHDSTNLLGKAWETLVQTWNHAWENMAEGVVDAIEGAKSWGDAWKGVLAEVKHEILTGFVKTAMGAIRATIDDLFRGIAGGGGAGGGLNIPGISLPGQSKTGPTGTASDPINVIVQNMGGAGGGLGGGVTSGLGTILAGFPGMPGAAGAGVGAGGIATTGLTVAGAAAAAFLPTILTMVDSLWGNKGAWYNDPEAFAKAMWAQSGGKFQIEDPATQRRAQGMFGLPENAQYWQRAVEAFKGLTDQLLGEAGLLSAKPPANPVTATTEERETAVATMTLLVDGLKATQADLQGKIIQALAKGDLLTAATLDAQLTTTNQSLSAAEGMLDRIGGNTEQAINSMSGIVASTEQQSEALRQAQSAVNALKAQEADLQQQIIVAIASGDMELATRLAGELGKVDGQLTTANGFLDFIKESTGQIALTAAQQGLLIEAAAQAFGPAALSPLIDTIDRLRGEQRDLQGQLAEAVRTGDTALQESLARRLDTVNGQLETARGQFSVMNTAIQAQTGNSEAVVSATRAMEEALKSGDIAAISKASGELRAAMDTQPDRIAQAQADLMAAIMSGNTAEIVTALGSLETAMAESAREETARQTTIKLGELMSLGAATAEQQQAALDAAKRAVDELKGEQGALLQALIIAVANGDTDVVNAILDQLSTVEGGIRSAQGFYDRLEALIPSEVDRIITSLGDIASNLLLVGGQESERMGLPTEWSAPDLARWRMPTDPAQQMADWQRADAMVSHWVEALQMAQDAYDAAVASGTASAQDLATLRGQVTTARQELGDWRTLAGLLTTALAASGNLTPQQVTGAKTATQTQITDLEERQGLLTRMLVIATDPAQRTIIEAQLRTIGSDLGAARAYLKFLNELNLDGTQRTTEQIAASARENSRVVVQGVTYTVGELRTQVRIAGDRMATLQEREADLMNQLRLAWASSDTETAQRLGRQLGEVRDQLYSTSNFIRDGNRAIETAVATTGASTARTISESVTGNSNSSTSAIVASQQQGSAMVAGAVGNAATSISTAVSATVSAAFQATSAVIQSGFGSLQAFAASVASGNLSASPMAAHSSGVGHPDTAIDALHWFGRATDTLNANGSYTRSYDLPNGLPEWYTQAAAQARTSGTSTPMNVSQGGPQGAVLDYVNPDGSIIRQFDLRNPFQVGPIDTSRTLSEGQTWASQSFVAPDRASFDAWLAAHGLEQMISQYTAEVNTVINQALSSYRANGATSTTGQAPYNPTNPYNYNVPTFDHGGIMDEDGMAMLHAREMVLPPDVSDMVTAMARVPTAPGAMSLPNPSMGAAASQNPIINIDKLYLPQVRDARGFIREVQREYNRLSPKMVPVSA